MENQETDKTKEYESKPKPAKIKKSVNQQKPKQAKTDNNGLMLLSLLHIIEEGSIKSLRRDFIDATTKQRYAITVTNYGNSIYDKPCNMHIRMDFKTPRGRKGE